MFGISFKNYYFLNISILILAIYQPQHGNILIDHNFNIGTSLINIRPWDSSVNRNIYFNEK